MSGGARRETYPGRNKPTGRAPRRERGSARLPHRSQPAAARYRRACPLQAPSWSVQHERRVASQVKDDVDIGIRDQLGRRPRGESSSMKPINVGVLGIGDISDVYISNLKSYDIVSVVACAGP